MYLCGWEWVDFLNVSSLILKGHYLVLMESWDKDVPLGLLKWEQDLSTPMQH